MRTGAQVRAWGRDHPWASSGLLAVVVLATSVLGRRGPDEPPLPAPSPLGWVLVVLACAALVVRLRRPVGVWAAVLAMSTTATVVDGGIGRTLPALLVAVYTVAAWRSGRAAVGVVLASAAVLVAASVVVAPGPTFSDATYAMLAFGGMVGAIGVAVRSQRAVVAAAQERARTAETTREEEAQRRVAEERLRIARELHDVVAHHISVVNVQAGVARHLLGTDLAAADAALATVREAAGLVLRETGSILGLLRTGEDGAGTEPVPGADRLPALVEDSRRAGLDVAWTCTGTPRPLAPASDLAAYRLVQEALTNASRHGTGSARLVVDWAADELALEVRNPAPGPAPVPAAGAGGGHGLLGMRERVAAAGGRLDVHRKDGGFVVRASLPYAAGAATSDPADVAGRSA